LGQVVDRGDLAERYGMEGPRRIAQANGADRDRLDDAGMALADIDDVADRERILDQDEEPGDDVLDERLAAEADGEADDAGAGKQRRDGDPELGEDDHRHQHDQDDEDAGAEERQQGPRAGAAGNRHAARIDAGKVALDRRAEDLPDDEGGEHDAANADEA